MYAGTTFRGHSGSIVGVHQKIDRLARRNLKKYEHKAAHFPGITDILHFEGNNGPDGVKRKQPGRDEPWHFIDPNNPNDTSLVEIINNHTYNLATALKDKDHERASFEAAWLSHVVVDGLTPAHHYPLNDKIEELWGKPHHERTSIKDKNIIKGINKRDTVSKNWQYWGAGGVFSAHISFELGVASMMATQVAYKNSQVSAKDVAMIQAVGYDDYFMKSLHRINKYKLYERFGENGWTHELADDIKKYLLPEIIKNVNLAWISAIDLSEKMNNER